MSATVTATNGAGAVTALSTLSPYATGRDSRNVVHDLIGGGIAVSLVPPRPRSGELALLFPDEASSTRCVDLHAIPTTFELVDTDEPSVGMIYVVDGRVTAELDEGTLEVWIVTVSYQEVMP